MCRMGLLNIGEMGLRLARIVGFNNQLITKNTTLIWWCKTHWCKNPELKIIGLIDANILQENMCFCPFKYGLIRTCSLLIHTYTAMLGFPPLLNSIYCEVAVTSLKIAKYIGMILVSQYGFKIVVLLAIGYPFLYLVLTSLGSQI